MNNKISDETQEQAVKVAKAIQKKGQTKEQTKLIAQGIEKGIAEYKKQQSKIARERDKQRKKAIKNHQNVAPMLIENKENKTSISWLSWFLLAMSWLGFLIYINLF